MHIFSKNLGDTVRRAREESHISQTELAENLSLDVRTIINIENYRGNPKLEVLFPLIRELKILPEQNSSRKINILMKSRNALFWNCLIAVNWS